MSISRETVLHVARLARLDLDAEELEPLQRDLAKILNYVEQLAELDTTDVQPTGQPAVAQAPLRPDARTPGLSHKEALSGCQRSSEGGFAVPGYAEES